MPRVHYASTEDTDMFYLTRARIHDPFFYIDTGAERFIFLNNLEIDAFNEGNKDPALKATPLNPLLQEARTLSGDTSASNKFALLLFRKYDLLEKSVQVSKHFPLDMADYLRSKGAMLDVVDSFLSERVIKSEAEVQSIRDSLRRTHKAFEYIEETLRVSAIVGDRLVYGGETLTSEYLKRKVDTVLFEQDMENRVGRIISSGRHAAMPHHGGTGPIRPHQTIVCDIFPRNRTNGYYADMTRTYVKGVPSDYVVKMYEAVKHAQDVSFEAIKPGMSAKEVHALSEQAILESGFDVGEEGYTHSLGHGLGLDVHELPFVSAYSDAVLQVGHVVTVEPGLYYPEWGGVRLEDVVVVTETGCDNLTSYERTLVIP